MEFNKEVGKRIRHARKMQNMSMRELGEKVGLSEGNIQRYEAGKIKGVDVNLLKAIANALHCSDRYLMLYDDKPAESTVQIPVLETVIAGIPIAAHKEILNYEGIPVSLAATGDFFGLKVTGSSMEPRIIAGDVVIVKQQSDVENGDVAVILINGEYTTLKKVIKGNGGITLIAFNIAAYEPHFYSWQDIESLPLKIIGKVVELRAKF